MKALMPITRLFVYACSFISIATIAQDKSWIEKSNRIAEEFALSDSERYPENASTLGFRQFDAKATQLEDDMETKNRKHLLRWQKRLKKELRQTTDPNIKIDLQVLQQSVEQSLEGQDLAKKYGDIPFFPASKVVFNSLQQLINPQSASDRKRAAIKRFELYVNGQGRFKPLLKAYESRVLAKEKLHPKEQIQPLKQEVEQYLAESPEYLKGIQGLLEESGSTDWNPSLTKFTAQLKSYDEFVKNHVLPKARTDYRLPTEVYAYILKVRGINASPKELIDMSLKDYKETYAQFENLAQKLAKKHKLNKNDPASVIRFLKKKLVTKPEEVKKLYQQADAWLAKTIVENKLVTLPKTPLVIRFAGDAESKANPVPHLKPPPLIGNRGERPEFVVPSQSSGKLPFDDFSYEASALILTAHEGRPGHDLQFSSMLDNGISTVRARYAFNNVNVEGWGLYAEDLVYPYLPLESQMSATQTRLWRIARAFLDPQIQLGLIKPERVIELFTKELGVSETMAGLELRRYTYDDPGQAPAYYFGLKQIQIAKAQLKKQLGSKFSEICFNDSLLSLGLLPVDVAAKRLAETMTCEATPF